MHGGYEEEIAPSLDINDTDKDESNNSIVNETFYKPSPENIYMDVSESECNIVNETLSQNNSSDVLTNVITELKYDEHIEPSVSAKRSSYFNIFECGMNLLDQLDVTYQRAFTASTKPSLVPKGLYKPSPARERFYNLFVNVILDKNYFINEDEICRAVNHMKYEYEEENERDIKNMVQDNDYKSPWKNKDATVATLFFQGDL